MAEKLQIEKLPKWAQEHIRTLTREREVAVRRLDEMTNAQSESPFFSDQYDCTESPPVSRRVYYQSGIRMSVVHEGVLLDIVLRGKTIELTWGDPKHMGGSVCCQPHSYQQVHLLAKENMR